MFPNPQQKWVLRWMSHWMASIDVAVGATIGWVLKTTYTGQEDHETLVEIENSIFCEFTNLVADYCCFWADC